VGGDKPGEERFELRREHHGGHNYFSPDIDRDAAGLELPVARYSHALGCSTTGGYVVPWHDIPWLVGTYVHGDFCSGRIGRLRHDGASIIEQMLLIDSELSITSFGQELEDNTYVPSRNDGIYLVVSAE
jgi:hypothetical protein